VRVGTLTLLGSLTNDGTIVGDLQTLLGPIGGRSGDRSVTQPGDGLSIVGDYAAGASSSLVMPDPVWRLTVSGDYDVAIDEHDRYDMASAELRIGSSSATGLEVMSLDIGADVAGLDRTIDGHFPIATVRLTGGVTTLVDAHDNALDGQGVCEALYVSSLVIEPGATLNTLGCRVYYETLANGGVVDTPSNLIPIAPPCVGDANGDGRTDVFDFNAVTGGFGSGPGASREDGDLNADGLVNVFDFNIVTADFGCGSS